MPVTTAFTIQDEIGVRNAQAVALLGSSPYKAFTYLDEGSSLDTNESSFKNLGAVGVLRFVKRESVHSPRVEISNTDNYFTSTNKLALSFWVKPSDYFSTMPWGMDTVEIPRTIIGNRQASITDTTGSIHGFSFGIERNATDPTTFDCTLNANGQIITTSGGVVGIGNFGEWCFVTISIDTTQDYMGFSVSIPAGVTFAADTLIYDSNDTVISPIGDINDSGGYVILSLDYYTPTSDGSKFYFDGWMSNLKFYNTAPASTVAVDVQTFFSGLIQSAWYLPNKTETIEIGAVAGLVAAYRLDHNQNVVVPDKHYKKQGFLASGFTGVSSNDFSSDVPTNFITHAPSPTSSVVFTGNNILKQRGYHSSSPAYVFDGYHNQFLQDYAFEVWFKCSSLPSPLQPRQFLIAKTKFDVGTPTTLLNGLYIALEYNAPDVNVRFYHENGLGITSTTDIEEDEWYHVAITASKGTSPLDSVGTPGFSQAYMFVTKDTPVNYNYDAYDEVDPIATAGIGVNSTDAFADFPLVVGGGETIHKYLQTPLSITAGTLVINGASSTIDLGVDLTNIGLVVGDELGLESPLPAIVEAQFIVITGIAGSVITFDNGVTALTKPDGTPYTNLNEGDFLGDFTVGRYVPIHFYTTAEPTTISDTFIGKMVEIRAWKAARTFSQVNTFRFKQLPID